MEENQSQKEILKEIETPMEEMDMEVEVVALFRFVKKPTSASSVSPILSKPTFEGSPTFPCHFSNLSLK